MKTFPLFSRLQTGSFLFVLFLFLSGCPGSKPNPNPPGPPSPPVPTTPPGQPILLSPICQASQNVLVSGLATGAIVTIFRSETAIGSATATGPDGSIALNQPLTAGDKLTAKQVNGTLSSPVSAAVEVVSGAPTSGKVFGGEVFFTAENGEQQIDAPVFLRGKTGGISFAVSSCCTKKVTVEIRDPKGKIIAQPTVADGTSGSFSINWDWKTAANLPVPGGLPVGKYAAVIRSECEPKPVEIPFYVIFDPAEVGGPTRFSLNETNIWFGAHQDASRALLYHLHPDDARIFGMAIAACAGQTEALKAAQLITDAEEKKFAYSLNYHTDDALVLLQNFTETQCADDAAFLTALFRSVGIPAHSSTADAALETGAANWTFDTWTEFLVKKTPASQPEWLIFHPHEYADMSAETRRIFGTTRGVATKNFNDIMIIADETWKQNEASDGQVDASYTRNECKEPQNLTKKSWVSELSQDYWGAAFSDCNGVAARTTASKADLELNLGDAGFGRTISGTLSTSPGSPFSKGVGGPPSIQVVGDLPESKRFPDTVFSVKTVKFSKAAGKPTADFELKLPATAPAGMELWVVSNSGKKVVAAQPFSLSNAVKASLKPLPADLKVGQEITLEAIISNDSKAVVNGISASARSPFALKIDGKASISVGKLNPGEQKTISWKARVTAPIEAGEIFLKVNSKDGGSATAAASLSVQ